jgi:CRISPR/Cas system-associated exonuclease Cas4 (RecB family)
MALATAPIPVSISVPAPAPPADPSLNPAQRELLAAVRASPDERPAYDPALRVGLRADLEAGLLPLLDALPPGETLHLSKYPLAQVHGCEARFLAAHEQPFSWSIPAARGSISHKAIELAVHWRGEPSPIALVDEAMDRLRQGQNSLAAFLTAAGDVDRAELRAEANDRVAKFLECFPPLRPAWRPVTESAARIDLLDGRVILQGRVDLTLGHARGATAGKALIDLKSGGFSPSHAEDLRFYALLETLRLGTPPSRLATYYLDSGRPHAEVVTVDTLHSAVRRTVDGARRMVELCYHDHPPVRRAGPACGWCPLAESCPEAAAAAGGALHGDDR